MFWQHCQFISGEYWYIYKHDDYQGNADFIFTKYNTIHQIEQYIYHSKAFKTCWSILIV